MERTPYMIIGWHAKSESNLVEKIGYLFDGEKDDSGNDLISEDLTDSIVNMQEYSGDYFVSAFCKRNPDFRARWEDKLSYNNFNFMSGVDDDIFFGLAISMVLREEEFEDLFKVAKDVLKFRFEGKELPPFEVFPIIWSV